MRVAVTRMVSNNRMMFGAGSLGTIALKRRTGTFEDFFLAVVMDADPHGAVLSLRPDDLEPRDEATSVALAHLRLEKLPEMF